MSVAIKEGGGTVPTLRRELTASQSLVDGHFVLDVGDGKVSKASASTTYLYGRFRPEFGVADYGIIELAQPDVWFLIQADAAVDKTMIGLMCDIVVDGTTGVHRADVGTGSKDVFQIREIVDATTRMIYVSVNPLFSQSAGIEV
jgi:hypothetical protein